MKQYIKNSRVLKTSPCDRLIRDGILTLKLQFDGTRKRLIHDLSAALQDGYMTACDSFRIKVNLKGFTFILK